jgi:hypothetical protein
MKWQPKRLKRWRMPENYFGPTWPEYFSACVGRSRDSDCMEESNFYFMLRALGGETNTVQVVREHHWAVGWIEWVAIHESDEASLRKADELRQALDDDPVFDRDDLSEREDHECEVMWTRGFQPSDRIRLLRERGCTEGFRLLRAAVNGDWSAASSLLPCPSEIIY